MTYIEWVTLIVQSICMSAIIATAYNNKQEAFIWCIILITLYSFMIDTQLWLLFLVIFIVDWAYERKINVTLGIQMLLGMLLQTFSQLVSLLAISIIEGLPIMVLHLNEITQFDTSILFIVCFVLLATIIYHFNFSFKGNSYSLMVGLLLGIILYIINGFLDALLYGNITLDDVQKFSIAFIAFGLVLLRTIFLFNKETEQSISAQRIETQNAMVKNNLLLIDGIQSNIQDLEHRMNYVLLSLKHMILDNKKEDALKIIQENTWNLKKASYYVNTNNPYFDNLFSRILKKYRSIGIVPACFLEIPKAKMDEDVYFISCLVDVLTQLCDLLDEKNEVSITIQVKSSHSLLKVVVSHITLETLQKIEFPQLPYAINPIDETTLEIKLIKAAVKNKNFSS